jgi:hypothetical protein
MDELEELMSGNNEPPRREMTGGDFLKVLAILYAFLVLLCVIAGVVGVKVLG